MSEGRWPANVILTPGMADVLDKQTSNLHNGAGSGARAADKGRSVLGAFLGTESSRTAYADEGGASRFFLAAWYSPDELEWIYEVGLRPYRQECA